MAKCGNDRDDGYFPERDRDDSAQAQAREAKRVCNGQDGYPVCPIRAACLEYALVIGEKYGVWGGMSERERSREKKRRVIEVRRLEQDRLDRIARRAAASRKAWETRRANTSTKTQRQGRAKGA